MDAGHDAPQTDALATDNRLGADSQTPDLRPNDANPSDARGETPAPDALANDGGTDGQSPVSGAIALYTFDEGSGTKVRDQVDPALDLTLRDPAAMRWLPGALRFESVALVSSNGSANKITAACKRSGAFSVEAWLAPATPTGVGPQRVVTLSASATQSNFMLGYGLATGLPSNTLSHRVLTEDSTGNPGAESAPVAQLDRVHVVFTHSHPDGAEVLYIDGIAEPLASRLGNFATWDPSQRLVIGNDPVADRPWLGKLHLVAIYDRGLSAQDVGQNFAAGADPELGSSGTRVADPIVMYDFSAGFGNLVRDRGNGAPHDLTIDNLSAVTWLPGALRLDSSARLSNAAAATKLIQACQASQEITIEAWVTPLRYDQSGPARIVTLAQDTTSHNFLLGQDVIPRNAFVARLRTSITDQHGKPAVATRPGAVAFALRHVVFTRAASGQEVFYVDTVARLQLLRTGSLAPWNSSYPLGLGSELSGDPQGWLGDLHRVAIYDRALSQAEVEQNFAAAP